MTDAKTAKNKHLSSDDRDEIKNCLDCGMTFKAIARRIGKDQTTVSREVKRHITVRGNDYIRRNEQGLEVPHKHCTLLLKAPFVCNPCERKTSCRKDRQFYLAKHAHEAYREVLSEARTGIALNKEAFYENDRIISEGIKKGQHLYHILQTHRLGVSKSTVYRHLKLGYLSIAAIDLPRVVKFKPRKKTARDYIPAKLKLGRTYEDFLEHLQLNRITSWVEMDTVIGTPGGKAILTFDFTFCNFMFGLLLDKKTAAEVSANIVKLKKHLLSLNLRFRDLFPTLLTDNGGEFADIYSFENDTDHLKESFLFFCDPNSAYQKPHVEKNHTLFRDIAPKGTSFDNFTQNTVNLIFSHVNAVKRLHLSGRSSFELFAFAFGERVPEALGISSIRPDQVIQSPKLLRMTQPIDR